MKSFFQLSFQNGFRSDTQRGFVALGQDDVVSAEEWVPPTFNQDQPPMTAPTIQPVQAPTTRPPNTSDTDWAKILAEGLKDAASGYGTYTQGQIAKMKAEADILKQKNPAVASLLPSDSKTATIALVVGGVAVLGLILVVAVK
jgi:hypothetical protein